MLYSQIDPDYKDEMLANSPLTIGSHGCYLTCIANLGNTTPKLLMEEGMKKNGFQGALLVSGVLANICGMNYEGATQSKPNNVCVAVTNDNAHLGIPTHFVILLPDGHIIDPLTHPCKPTENKYNFFQYRLFSNIKMELNEEPEKTWDEAGNKFVRENGISNAERLDQPVTRRELNTIIHRALNPEVRTKPLQP